MKKKKDEITIRSSAAEYLTYVASIGDQQDSIEMRYEDENIWLTQKMMATLYDVGTNTINYHIKKIFEDSELQEDSVIRKFRITAADGKSYSTNHYSLEMIIAVGFKVNSERAVQFRKWVNQIAKDYTIKGWVMDDERLKRGTYLTEKYFDEQLERIREIRASERKFYQKITDLYATAIDYDKNSATTRRFYATVQNKMHYAVHGHTAAELIVERADHTREHMGLTTWADAPEGKIKDIETNEQGRRLLEQYGYWGNKGNAFYMQFRHQVMVTGAVSTVICVLLLTFLLYWKKKEDACHQKILDQLEEILIRFRENKFDDLLKTENHAELEKLNDQLEAIGHHIQLLKEEAREEKESTKEMVSDISHQLKTPVAALDTCFSVLMQNDLSATEQEEFRIRCRSALDGLETLLQSLLEISKMETGLIQINKKKLPLMDTVISAVNCTYPKADEKEIEFVFDYAKELETCMVMQDKRWLGEAVINVLDNAIKYSPGGSKIFIRLQKRNDLVRMEIEDQGIGIPQNEYHKIFQRFYRGSSREVMEKSGTGIGLFLSREIIEKHAGTITVTSGKKKKGSTFVIQLPYVG